MYCVPSHTKNFKNLINLQERGRDNYMYTKTILLEKELKFDNVKNYVEDLCKLDKREGRANYVKEIFEKLGLEVSTEPVSYSIPPYIGKKIGEDEIIATDLNVYAEYKGNPDTDSYILVTAHHDAVTISPGANDNASGTSLLLSLAETLVYNKDKINVKFASFGLEELGLIGSDKYATNLSKDEIKKIKAAINLDCVGIGSDLAIITQDAYEYTTPWVNKVIEETAEAHDIKYKEATALFGASDHDSLLKVGVPATFLCRMENGRIPYIHTPKDTPDKINEDQLKEIGELSYYAIFELDAAQQSDSEIRMQKTRSKPKQVIYL
jgi:hypothetical protein